jgi:ribose transport system substrate-binding protein
MRDDAVVKTRNPWKLAIAAAAAGSVLLTACSDDSSDDSSGGGGGDSGGAEVDVAAAQEVVDRLIEPPTEFPVTEPLAELPPEGSTAAFLDLGTPTTAAFYDYLVEAGEVLGIEVQRVQTGQSPQEINSAMNSVVESRPDAVIDVAVDPAVWTPQLEALREAGTVVVPVSIVNGEEFGFDDSQIGQGAAGARENGKAVASGLLAETNGEATNLVFYRVPEVTFTPFLLEGVEERLAEQCPDCELRVVDISAGELGSTAPNSIVSDLQANPETDAFIASVDELQMGLPAAMRVAGMDVPGMGTSPNAVNLQQIAEGQELGALGTDFNMIAWLTMDRVARELVGQEFDYSFFGEEATSALQTIITQDNVPEDMQRGYVAFEDYEARFTELWTGQ